MSDKKCDLCGNPNVYMSSVNINLCRIHFENLLRDAKALNKELSLEREEE